MSNDDKEEAEVERIAQSWLRNIDAAKVRPAVLEDIRRGVAEVRRTDGHFVLAEYGAELEGGQLYTSILPL
jgi:hypothetical protein